MSLLDLRTFVTCFVHKGYREASKPCKVISASAGTDMRQKPPNVPAQSMSHLEGCSRPGSWEGASPPPGSSPCRATMHTCQCLRCPLQDSG